MFFYEIGSDGADRLMQADYGRAAIYCVRELRLRNVGSRPFFEPNKNQRILALINQLQTRREFIAVFDIVSLHDPNDPQ